MKPFGMVLLPTAALLLACDGSPEEERYPLARPATLAEARPAPPGTVPRGTVAALALLAPPGPPPTMAMLRQGREGYQVFCTPCHGANGDGDGAITHMGFSNPPSFHQDRLADVEPARIVAVVSEGVGKMLPLAEQIPPEERWAIAYYVKALQTSQRPPAARAAGERPGPSRP